MKWITREHPKIDRIACPWLVMYDALYAWCKSLQHESHRWPPAGFSLVS
jgi:hypothetical protein